MSVRAAIVAVALLAWCTGAVAAQDAPEMVTPRYTFQIGDVVEFKFPYSPEIDFSAPVRPDGAIYFPYLGDVALFRRTVPELAEILRSRYADVLLSPEITIVVRSFQAPRVFVTGEVLAPGKMDFRHGMTVSQALHSAGGFRDTANRKQVILLRVIEPGALRVSPVSLARRNGHVDDIPLAPDDIILVPRSRIARLSQIIQQYSRDLLPVSSLGVFFNLVGSTGASVSLGGAPQ